MTSPTRPSRESITERITRLITPGRDGRYVDSEARHARNVTLAFILLIGAVVVVVLLGLLYGFWENNLKPLANVNGVEVGRSTWQDRQRLEEFRAGRAEATVRAGLADGSMDVDAGNSRLDDIAAGLADGPGGAMTTLVELLHQEQLAQERGISLEPGELDAALAADGTLPETRRVSVLVITSDEAQIGLPETPDSRAQARAKAEEALAAIKSGTSVADLVEEYSPSLVDIKGDLGFVTEGDIGDPVWWEAIAALDEGGVTDIIEVPTGELLIGRVSKIAPAVTDPGLAEAAASAVGAEVHRRNVELEAVAAKLEDDIRAEALAAEHEQVKLAEILIAGDTTVDPATDEGMIHARHILFGPEVEPAEDGTEVDVADIPEDDPAWDAAQAEADAAAADLRAIEDPAARAEAFAARARADSDDTTSGLIGGDLGFFGREAMVPEFADALFDAEGLTEGDIIGPVRSDFGWHVIMYEDARAPIAERLEAVQAALAAPGADFAAVAAEHSDGPDAAEGGELGWRVVDELDDLAALALEAVDVGEATEAVDDAERGWVIYQKQDEATRALDPDAAARRASSAFTEWYRAERTRADGERRITIDGSVSG